MSNFHQITLDPTVRTRRRYSVLDIQISTYQELIKNDNRQPSKDDDVVENY